MSILENSRHEKYAQELAKGKTSYEAELAAELTLAPCVNLKRFYVYLLIDPRTDLVFYIGKGTKNRAHHHVKEWKSGQAGNALKFEMIGSIIRDGYEVVPRCLVDDLEEGDALDLERAMIHAVGIRRLTNLSRGEQSDKAKALALVRDCLSRIRPFCRWQNYILPQLGYEEGYESPEHLYWDIIGFLSEDLAKMEGRVTRKFPAMFKPQVSS